MLTSKEVNAMYDDLVEKFYPKPSYSFCSACRVVTIGYVSWDFAKDLEGAPSFPHKPDCPR
jgi:hypothetical protein